LGSSFTPSYCQGYPARGVPSIRTFVHLIFACLRCPFLRLALCALQVTPDDHDKITGHLRSWASTADTSCNLIITTGGTGFGPRDVTPEATMSVLQKHLPALSQAILTATSTEEPLSFLSRGTAGVIGDRTVVLNVPGAPRAVSQHLRVGLPMLAHTVASLSGAQGKDST
jgi:molybdenum cofactor synthesis domain-containing protein